MLLLALAAACAGGPSHHPDRPGSVDADARPIAHYTPARNWMNDPNGLVRYAGEYHLFYQYNPQGTGWGNMSWGHAVSRDLVHWRELPVAIPHTDDEEVFSGSVVVDKADTSGFGRPGRPAMVAIYTSHDTRTGVQAQSLAYSTDKGRTWTRYDRNPVLDVGAKDFRDPKVFWYEKGGYWVMAAVLAEEHVVKLFRSDDLRTWSHLSDFGPAHAVGGVWEMPDLFELPVDGDSRDTRWVLLVSLNPGAVAGGSGTQYFVGDFDGTRFTPEQAPGGDPTSGTSFASFDDTDYGAWTATGTAFGQGPARGSLPGQQPVEGFTGRGFASSFNGGDASTGRLTSPEFRIRDRFINLLIGGGSRPDTSVNLLVDGQVVRSATGSDTERLDRTSWDVAALRGRHARIEVVDQATDSWGHVSVDDIRFAAGPDLPRLPTADWVDHGKDFYAASTYNDAPGGDRLLMGWMSNWEYAADTPDLGWRGAMALPRRLELRTVGGRVRLVQQPVEGLESALGPPALRWTDVDLADDRPLPGRADGTALQIRARIDVGTAHDVGVTAFGDSRHRTVIGYDAVNGRLYVDRTGSGRDAISPAFPGRHEAPLVTTDGILDLRIVLDKTSVEVFGGDGEAVITDQVFPPPGADRSSVFAHGGSARLLSLEVRPLQPD